MPNPFRNWIAGDAWEPPEADVGEIGIQAFDACRGSIAATLAEHRTTAVLVRGAPGSGKTHLMRRLRAYLAQSPDERLRETLFVYVRLSTTSNMIWRHLRRRIVDDLMRASASGSMQLELLLYRILASAGSRGRLLDQWKHDLAAGMPWNERAFAHALEVTLRRLPESDLASLKLFETLQGEAHLSPAWFRCSAAWFIAATWCWCARGSAAIPLPLPIWRNSVWLRTPSKNRTPNMWRAR